MWTSQDYIADSQIVHAMIHKETYEFNTFAPAPVGEIQEDTETEKKNDWYQSRSQGFSLEGG